MFFALSAWSFSPTGWDWTHVGGWKEPPRGPLAHHSVQTATENGSGPILVGDGTTRHHQGFSFLSCTKANQKCIRIVHSMGKVAALTRNRSLSFIVSVFTVCQASLVKWWVLIPSLCSQLLCLVGEAFDDHSDDVCGAVINIRAKGDKIAIWTTNCENKEAITQIGWAELKNSDENEGNVLCTPQLESHF